MLKHIIYPFLQIRAKVLANLIQPHIPNKSSILDIGCGNLLISKNLKKKIKIKVRGIDVLDMNLTNLPHQVFNGKKIPFANNSFDLSLLISVLHHAKNQQALLKEVKRVTKKRIIILEDVYFSSIEKFWIKAMDVIGNIPEERKMNFALSFHSTKEWEEIFSKHSLEVVHKKVFFNFLRCTHHVLYVLGEAKKQNR